MSHKAISISVSAFVTTFASLNSIALWPATSGVDIFVISSAWPFPRVEHLRALGVARAIENQSYVILSNRVGKDGGVPFCGSSAIIDPYGVIVAAASTDREELVDRRAIAGT